MSGHTEQLPDFDALWDYDSPAETERRFSQIVPDARRAGDQSYLAGLLTQIARAQGLQDRFDDAHATLDSVTSILPEGPSIARVRYLLERGRAFNSAGQPETAAGLFVQARDEAASLADDAYVVDALHMMGICAPKAERLQWNLQALAKAEQSDQPRATNWRGSLYNNIGWTYFDAGRYELALGYFRRVVAWHTERNAPRLRVIAAWCVAKTLRMAGRPDEALAQQLELLDEITEAQRPDGYVNAEIGECLLALHCHDEARAYFAQAYDLLSQDAQLVRHDPAGIERLRALAGI